MNKKEIQKLMIDLDIKPVSVAKKAKVTRGAISRLLSGDMESKRLKRVMAKMLGKKVSDLWPEAA